MREIKLQDRLRYRFDNLMSRGMVAIIGWLFLITLLVIIVVSVVALLTGVGETDGLLKTIWTSLMHTIDAGNLAGDDTGDIGFVALMFVITGFGVFVFSVLIGILTNAINTKVEDLRKGRSFVVEQDHTVILGWGPQIFSIISELVIANQNRPRACIAILAEQDKVEMEDEIRARVGDTGRTRVVCRTGSPIDLADLQIVNPEAARAVIILSGESDDPDAHVIKSILALTSIGRDHKYHIVAEIRDSENLEVARLVGRDSALFLPVSDLISRIAVQTCRQSGLSVAYMELLDFGGDEIYFHAEPALAGKTLGEALFAYETSTVIGLRRKDGRVQLKPALDTTIQRGDQLIAISEDDDTVVLAGHANVEQMVQRQMMARPANAAPQPERTLILGWNRRAPIVINQLDLYVAPGSEVTVVAESSGVEEMLAAECGDLQNLKVTYVASSTTSRRTLDDLHVQSYDHIITLSYMDDLAVQEADARTLITLLHLRDISEKMGRSFSIVSEMLDVRNRELAEVTRADDFIVSDKLISLMLSQVSENRELMDVLMDLFDPEGAELYLKPAADYVKLGQPVNFYTVVAAARERDEIAVGYRLAAEAGEVAHAYGVHLNPHKAQAITLGSDDKVIVLAEN